jgi:predicted O-methyltransferase YrrM
MADLAKAIVSIVEKRNLQDVIALLKMHIESLVGHGDSNLTPVKASVPICGGGKTLVGLGGTSCYNYDRPDKQNETPSSMNSVLSEILETGATKTANGSTTVEVHSSISSTEGQFLQKLVRQLDPNVSLEVGLAHGISALFICDALNPSKRTQHIAIDPNQHGGPWGDSWDGIGIANLRRAGYGDIVRLIEAPSYRALAELEGSGQRVDFAFIDGWHTFDFTLVDFFFIDRMLNVGGVVAFDDANTSWPAVRKVCRFVKTNLAYSVLGVNGPDPEPSLKRRLSERLLCRSPFRTLLRPEIITPDGSIGLVGSCIAFQKKADDSRRWNHFVDF